MAEADLAEEIHGTRDDLTSAFKDMKHLHVVTGSFPPETTAGAKSFFKLLYPFSRQPDLHLEITTFAPAMLAEHDESLADHLNGMHVNRVRWRGQLLFRAANRMFHLYTDPYVLFAVACRGLLRRRPRAEVYLLRGQYFSTFLLAPFIRQRLQRPVVLFYSDPWLENFYQDWTPALRRRCARHEAGALASASGVIFTNTDTRDRVLSRYPGRRLPVLVVPHTFLAELHQPQAASRTDAEILFTFAGHFYGERQPLPLFEALASLRQEDPELARRVRFQIIGPSPRAYRHHFVRYQEQVNALGIASQVIFRGRLDYRSTLQALCASQVLVNLDAPAERSLFLPSKLVDYLGCRLPIWTLSPPGPAAELVAAYGGVVTDPRDHAGIQRDLARCARRCLQGDWHLHHEFAGQFESRRVYPKLKGFLNDIVASS